MCLKGNNLANLGLIIWQLRFTKEILLDEETCQL